MSGKSKRFFQQNPAPQLWCETQIHTFLVKFQCLVILFIQSDSKSDCGSAMLNPPINCRWYAGETPLVLARNTTNPHFFVKYGQNTWNHIFVVGPQKKKTLNPDSLFANPFCSEVASLIICIYIYMCVCMFVYLFIYLFILFLYIYLCIYYYMKLYEIIVNNLKPS